MTTAKIHQRPCGQLPEIIEGTTFLQLQCTMNSQSGRPGQRPGSPNVVTSDVDIARPGQGTTKLCQACDARNCGNVECTTLNHDPFTACEAMNRA